MGSPSIQGGMTALEQHQALLEERRYQEEQEEKRRAQAISDEQERLRLAEAEKERLAAEEAKKIADIDAAEQAIIEERRATMKMEEQKPKLSSAFSDALLKGLQYQTKETK